METIFLVEDEPNIRMLTGMHLQLAGYTVLELEDAAYQHAAGADGFGDPQRFRVREGQHQGFRQDLEHSHKQRDSGRNRHKDQRAPVCFAASELPALREQGLIGKLPVWPFTPDNFLFSSLGKGKKRQFIMNCRKGLLA